ncbi:hypothetical protein HY641_04025 [Candidatus Woesearchaeota archaeon]|nr:hypothetical protein [Candidatus Woesearchaeota archaeon]
MNKRAQLPNIIVVLIIMLVTLAVMILFARYIFTTGSEIVGTVAPATCNGRSAEDYYNAISQNLEARRIAQSREELEAYAACKEFKGKRIPEELEDEIFAVAKADWESDFSRKDYTESKVLLAYYISQFPDSPRTDQTLAMIKRSEDAEAGRLSMPVPPTEVIA